MNRFVASFGQLLLLCSLPLSAVSATFERVSNFALLDQHGAHHELRRYGDSKAVVILSAAASCIETLDLLPKYKLLRTTWEREGVVFLSIASAPDQVVEDIRLMDELYHWDMPILLDESQLVAENLGLSRAGQLVVIEPNRLQVLYRGGLSEVVAASNLNVMLANVLAAAVESSLEGITQTVNVSSDGCELDFPGKNRDLVAIPDYTEIVAPILREKCATCHIEGGIAPFAMNSHLMVQGWSPMMREVLMTKRMPPAQVDPNINHFDNASYMSAKEMQALIHWIDAGSPRGKGLEDPLTEIAPIESQWQLGEPDFIVEVPAIRVPATGVLDYENVTINLPLDKEVWVKSVQHIPGDNRVLHHLLSFIVPANYDEQIIEGENDEYREFLESYAPGKEAASTYPQGSGVRIPKGSAVQMSLHYTPFGKEVIDKTRIGLYFAAVQPKHQYSTYSLSHGGKNIRIPAGVSDHKMSASHVFEDEIVLHGLRPHMHYRGKQMRMSVIYPNGTRADIINVPDYNFAWQLTYRLTEPMRLPAGSRVLVEGAFDNSEYNLGNPDPGALVKGGAQSWDEMFIGYFSYHKVTPL